MIHSLISSLMGKLISSQAAEECAVFVVGGLAQGYHKVPLHSK